MTDCRDKSEIKPIITGITGGIGSGKSHAAKFLADKFAISFLSADNVVHDLLEPEMPGWEAIKGLNTLFVNPDQTINKPLLRKKLFENDKLRKNINAAIHPLVKKEICSEIIKKTTETNSFFLVEVPLLYEAGWQDMFDEIIVVYASEKNCITRIMERDKVSYQQAKTSVESQWSLTEKAEMADHVIDNNGSWSDTELQLVHLGNLLWKRGNQIKKWKGM